MTLRNKVHIDRSPRSEAARLAVDTDMPVLQACLQSDLQADMQQTSRQPRWAPGGSGA